MRVKFILNRIDSYPSARRVRNSDGDYEKNEDGTFKMEPVQTKTLVFAAVEPNDDPKHENSEFWDANPAGDLTLNIVSPDSVAEFELHKEYYLDVTPALDFEPEAEEE